VGCFVEAVDDVAEEPGRRGADRVIKPMPLGTLAAGRQRAGVYTRISLDRWGTSEAPERQLADCRDEIERRGLVLIEHYSDRDVSAYKQVRRPQYERMLRDLRAGRLDVVVVWKLDRLTRQGIRGINQFIDALGDSEFVSVT
jgi:hypothetical protein